MHIGQLNSLFRLLITQDFKSLALAFARRTLRPMRGERWAVTLDGNSLGRMVTGHEVGLDAERGAWARWMWPQGQLDISQLETLEVRFGSQPCSQPKLRITTGFEGAFPALHLVIHVSFMLQGERRTVRLTGRMN